MERIHFCDRCAHSKPAPRQQTCWVGGKAFCSTTCKAYLAEVKAERERKYQLFILPYLAKKAEQDMTEGQKLEQQAFAAAKEYAFSNKEIPTGMQVGGNNNPLVYSPSPAGGILIP